MIISLAGKRYALKAVRLRSYVYGISPDRKIYYRPGDSEHLFQQLVAASLQAGGCLEAFYPRQLKAVVGCLAAVLLPTLQTQFADWVNTEEDVKYVRIAGTRIDVLRKHLKDDFGKFELHKECITIGKGVKTRSCYLATLMHECVHAALRYGGASQLLDIDLEEVVAENLALVLLPALLKHRGVLDVSSKS